MKGGRGLILYTVLWCRFCAQQRLSDSNKLRVFPHPRTVRKRRAKAGEELFNRMQLNAVYKWLSVSVWACYSYKGHHYWEGHAQLAGRKRQAVRGDDGRSACTILRSLPQLTVENKKALLPSRVTTTFPLNMWVLVRRVLPSQLLHSVVTMFWGWFTSCLKEGNYLGRRFFFFFKCLSAKGTFLLNVTEIHRLPSVWRLIQKIWMASGGVRKSQNTLAINWGCRLKRG